MLPVFLFLTVAQSAPPASLTAPEILDRMVRADAQRVVALAGYSGIRHYRFENKKHNKRAEMTVRMNCGPDGVKTFEVLDETGSGFVRSHIIRKMIDAEQEASEKGERKETRIIPENYDFTFAGTDLLDGRPSYVLEISSKKPSKFSMIGKIWVDAEDFAIARIEGRPAKNPSFWIRSVQVTQQYGRTGPFWLPARNQSVAQAKIFGTTEVVIEYSDYKTSVREAQARARTPEDSRQ